MNSCVCRCKRWRVVLAVRNCIWLRNILHGPPVVGCAPGGAADTLARVVRRASHRTFSEDSIFRRREPRGGDKDIDVRTPADGFRCLSIQHRGASAPLVNDFDFSRNTGFPGLPGHARASVSACGKFRRVHCLRQGKSRQGWMPSAGKQAAAPHMAGELFKNDRRHSISFMPKSGAAAPRWRICSAGGR